MDLERFEHELDNPPRPPSGSWRPHVIALSRRQTRDFAKLCKTRGIPRVDTLEGQLMELAAVRLPAADPAERRSFVEEALAAHEDGAALGWWVYLPWEHRAFHLLGPDDYFDVVTDRNRDKITREEQRLLRARRVGVVGLSVGGEAAFTVAQEHLCGTIVLADFDRLDLSNLNRLGTGFDALGVNKAVILARRIAKVDPYLDVRVFEDGVTRDNAAEFLDGLDLLLEECDGLQMKYHLRQEARRVGLNVIFAADERGFLSVEPYAQHAELRPFHGRIDAPQAPREEYDTPLEFLKALSEWMGGWERLSERSRSSLRQVGETLSGYPQLASEARYAAGQLGHVARKLLLGESLPPFLHHLDLDEVLSSIDSERL